MTRKLVKALALVSLACLAFAPATFAVGIGAQRLAAPPHRIASPRPATASPLIAPAATCPGQGSPAAPVEVQEQAMLCMTNFARAEAGLAELGEDEVLDRSADEKAGDVLRCDSFSHSACGREFTYWIRESGYLGDSCWQAGENLAWGTGDYGSVREIFQAWMLSPTHRENILGDYAQVGIGVVTGELEGHADAHVWTAHFGSHCEG